MGLPSLGWFVTGSQDNKGFEEINVRNACLCRGASIQNEKQHCLPLLVTAISFSPVSNSVGFSPQLTQTKGSRNECPSLVGKKDTDYFSNLFDIHLQALPFTPSLPCFKKWQAFKGAPFPFRIMHLLTLKAAAQILFCFVLNKKHLYSSLFDYGSILNPFVPLLGFLNKLCLKTFTR